MGQALGQTHHPKFRCSSPNSRPLARQSSGEDSSSREVTDPLLSMPTESGAPNNKLATDCNTLLIAVYVVCDRGRAYLVVSEQSTKGGASRSHERRHANGDEHTNRGDQVRG
jgi:hypothetical protein